MSVGINFKVDKDLCNQCGHCIADCRSEIIEPDEEGFPYIAAENEEKCIGCQHCLVICPDGGITIFDIDPDNCVPKSKMPAADQVEALIRMRRSIRNYKEDEIPPAKIEEILTVASNAPTGRNDDRVMFTVIETSEAFKRYKDKFYARIKEMDEADDIPPSLAFLKKLPEIYENGEDMIFRGAPHFVLASVLSDAASPQADGFISLTSMELYAQSLGFGTVWAGIAMWVMGLAPDLYYDLGIPREHHLVYGMMLGVPAVEYHRGVQRDDVVINRPEI